MNSCAVWEHRHRQPRVQQKSLRGWWRRCRLGLGPRGFGDLRKVERSIARTDPKRQQIEIEGLAQLESARFDAGEQEQRHQAHHSRGDENHRVALPADLHARENCCADERTTDDRRTLHDVVNRHDAGAPLAGDDIEN